MEVHNAALARACRIERVPTVTAWRRLQKRLSTYARTHKCNPPVPPELSSASWAKSPRKAVDFVWPKTVQWAQANGCSHEIEALGSSDFQAIGTVPPNDMLPESYNDDVGFILKKLNEHKTWTKAKFSLDEELQRAIKKKRYFLFWGHPYNFHLSPTGSSYLYDVPVNKRGRLSSFRGKRVRIICMGTGQFSYLYAVGLVQL